MDTAKLQTLVARLLEALGARVEDISVSGETRVVAQVSTPDAQALIGPGGAHLQALNVLARRLAEAETGERSTHFLIDVNNYHADRLKTLCENAQLLAQRARLFKHDVEMSPTGSYERLVIHELFSSDPEIATESQGEGKTRHIVLKYKTKSL